MSSRPRKTTMSDRVVKITRDNLHLAGGWTEGPQPGPSDEEVSRYVLLSGETPVMYGSFLHHRDTTADPSVIVREWHCSDDHLGDAKAFFSGVASQIGEEMPHKGFFLVQCKGAAHVGEKLSTHAAFMKAPKIGRDIRYDGEDDGLEDDREPAMGDDEEEEGEETIPPGVDPMDFLMQKLEDKYRSVYIADPDKYDIDMQKQISLLYLEMYWLVMTEPERLEQFRTDTMPNSMWDTELGMAFLNLTLEDITPPEDEENGDSSEWIRERIAEINELGEEATPKDLALWSIFSTALTEGMEPAELWLAPGFIGRRSRGRRARSRRTARRARRGGPRRRGFTNWLRRRGRPRRRVRRRRRRRRTLRPLTAAARALTYPYYLLPPYDYYYYYPYDDYYYY